MNPELSTRVHTLLHAIPKGRVISYGALGKLAGCGPRQIGQVLRRLPKNTRLPWFRVINSAGKISLPPGSGYERQRRLLENEGVEFSLKGRIDLNRFGWHG